MKGAQKGRSEYRASWGKGNSGSGLETGATGLAGGRGLLRKHSVTGAEGKAFLQPAWR